MSKQDRVSQQSPTIFIPAFEDKLLDPKRTLAFYLRKIEPFRIKDGKDELKLFLTVNKPHRPVSAQTHSSWIVKLIKRAYKQNQKHIGTVKGHSTRSVGSSWVLFKGAGMTDILEVQTGVSQICL